MKRERERHENRADVSLVKQEVLDTVRKEEAGGSVQTTPSQTSTNTEPTELRQRAGTWVGRGRGAGWSLKS